MEQFIQQKYFLAEAKEELEHWKDLRRELAEELYEEELDKHTIIVPGPRALGYNPKIFRDGQQCTCRKDDYFTCGDPHARNMYGFGE